MGNEVKYGAEVFVVWKPSEAWVAAAKEQVRAAGRSMEMTCPREERVAEIHLGAMVLVPLATVPQAEWPAFRVDIGRLMVQGEDGTVRPAALKLLDLEQRVLLKAKETHPQLAAMVSRALAESS